MNNQRAFSFVEILISLFLIVTISLGLLNEQLLVKRRLHLIQQQFQTWLDKNNRIERQYFQS